MFKETWYDYSLDGWATQYGVPLQLSLTLHLASLAPDFAYQVAEIGASDTTVDFGLVETSKNSVVMQLNLDLDNDGIKEKYSIEKSTKATMHKDTAGNEEEGYETIQEALDASTDLTEEEKEEAYLTFEEKMAEIEAELQQKGTVNFGYFVFYSHPNTSSSASFNDYRNFYENDEYLINVETSEELSEIINLLISYDLAEKVEDENGNSRLKIKSDSDINKVAEVKRLFTTYFKLEDLKDRKTDMYNIHNNDDVGNFTSWSKTEEGLYKHEDKEHYYKPNDYLCISDYSKYHCFYQATMNEVWDWFFNGAEIKISESLWDQFWGTIEKNWPFREYYRLVDQDGNPYTFDASSYDKFVCVNGGDTYYPNGDEGWFWRRSIPKVIADAIKEQAELPDYEAVLEILDSAVDIETEDFTRYVPFIIGVTGHWYQDISFEGCYEWDDSQSAKTNEYAYTATTSDTTAIKNASNNNILWIKETTQGRLTQIAEGKKVGEPGERIKNLIDNRTYYKYDGVQKSESKEKIDFKETAVDSIAMLEQIGGYDAQYIIRLFKELMASYDIYFEETEGTEMKKELFAKVIKDYNGQLLTDGEDCVYKANIPPAQQGFEVDLDIQAPCNGKITYRTDDTVCILIDAPKEDFDGYTILISGFEVDESVLADSKVKETDVLGKTIKQDLKLTLRDKNGAIVKNKYVMSTTDANGNLTTIDSQVAATYNMTDEELDTIYACVRQEAGNTYEGAVAVMTCIMNRVENDGFTGNTPYEVLTQPNQFCYSIDDYWRQYKNGNVEETVKKAVKDVLAGKRTHNYYYFKTNEEQYRIAYPNGENIEGNWYHI